MTMPANPGPAGAPRFSVGTVISTSLKVISANLLRFLGIIVAIALPGVLLIAVAIVGMTDAAPTATGHALNFNLRGGTGSQILFMLFVGAVILVVYVMIQCAITYGTLQTLRGRKAEIGACLSNGLAAMPRVLLASLALAAIAVVLVVIFQVLFPPDTGTGTGTGAAGRAVFAFGIMAVLIFIVIMVWVFVPVIVVERAGLVASFRRSMALTKGHRWAILGIFALVALANWVVNYVSVVLPKIGAPAAGGALNVAAQLFFMALGAVLAAVGYYCLRAEKEGVGIDEVVRVFD